MITNMLRRTHDRPGRAHLFRTSTVVAAALAAGVVSGCSSSSSSPAAAASGASARTASASAVATSAIDPAAAVGTPSLDPAAQALLPASIRNSGQLTIGINPDNVLHGYLNPGTQQLQGFEPDLDTALAAVLGVKIKYTDVAFEELVPGVASGRFDVAQGDLGDNSLREKQIDFVDYNWLTFALTVPAGNPQHLTSVMDLCGKTLGYQAGSTTILQNALKHCKADGKPNPAYVSYPDAASLQLAQQSGRVSPSTVIETPQVVYDLDVVKQNIDDIDAPQVGNLLEGLGLKKGSTQLENALVAAVKDLQKDGIYKAVFTKWHIPQLEVKAPGINIGSQASNYIQTSAS